MALEADAESEPAPPEAAPPGRCPPDAPAIVRPPAARSGPVQEHERIIVLDVLRGFALLGILMVNMITFAMPVSEFLSPDLKEMSTGDRAAWAFVTVFFQYKFMSLFSLLFGAGLVLQMLRAQRAGRAFAPLYLRRLAVLAVMGLLHAWLLWYGDILFLYACLGFWLLLLRSIPARVMLWIAGIIIIALASFSMAIGVVGVLAGEDFQPQGADAADDAPGTSETVPAAIAAPSTQTPASARGEAGEEVDDAIGDDGLAEPADEPADRRASPTWLREHLPAVAFILDSGGDFQSQEWRQAETRAYEHGPLLDALAFRIVTWLFSMISSLFGFGWHSLAMFLTGAALLKLGYFSAQMRRWHLATMLVGLGLGLTLELAATAGAYVGLTGDHWTLTAFAVAINEIGSVLMCLGMVGAISLLVWGGSLRWITRMIACAGRLALTNYLAQTVIATAFMYWWGLGWFGDVSRPQQVTLALAIWSFQVIASSLYLRIFSIGPVEWAWRTLTYLRLQPALRRGGGALGPAARSPG